MCDDSWRSDRLNGIWLKSVDGQLSRSHTYANRRTHKHTLLAGPVGNKEKKIAFVLLSLSGCCVSGGGLEEAWRGGTGGAGWVDLCVFGWQKKKENGLPLFIKPRQIQLACGLPSNPINLLSCESTQQLLPISHFSQPLIRSAQDIQWGSLQLHLRCYSCCRGFKTSASIPISLSLLSFSFTLLLLHPPVTSLLPSPFHSLSRFFNPPHLFRRLTLHLSLFFLSLLRCVATTETTKQVGQ